MKIPQNWLDEDFAIFEKMRSHKAPYTIVVEGIELIVLPNVFSPKYYSDSLWFAQELSKLTKGKSVLEIGTGTGIIAIFCSLNGAKVVATDINEIAVKNAKINAKEHNLSIDIRYGNMFSPIRQNEKFDIIFWDHPFTNCREEVEDILSKAGFDKNYQELRKYISGAKAHLSTNGKLLLGTGSFADLEEIKKIAEENGYVLTLIVKKSLPFTAGSDIPNEYFIYELVKY